MKKNKIIICCFGNHLTGYGHVTRSVNLLNYFEKKYKCEIFTNKDGKLFCNNILKQKKNIYKISNFEKIYLKVDKKFFNNILLIGIANIIDLTALKQKKIFTKIINIDDKFVKKTDIDISIILEKCTE